MKEDTNSYNIACFNMWPLINDAWRIMLSTFSTRVDGPFIRNHGHDAILTPRVRCFTSQAYKNFEQSVVSYRIASGLVCGRYYSEITAPSRAVFSYIKP